MGIKDRLRLGKIVIGQCMGQVSDLLRHASRAGNTEGRNAGAGLHQQSVRVADMVGWVPELTKRSFSMAGKHATTRSARSTSVGVEAPKLEDLRAARSMASTTGGKAWPRIIGQI